MAAGLVRINLCTFLVPTDRTVSLVTIRVWNLSSRISVSCFGSHGNPQLKGSISSGVNLAHFVSWECSSTVHRSAKTAAVCLHPQVSVLCPLGVAKIEAVVQTIAAEIEEYLKVAENLKIEPEIMEAEEGKTGIKRKALRQLVETGRAHREGSGKRGDPFKYRFSFSCSLDIPPGTRKQDTEMVAQAPRKQYRYSRSQFFDRFDPFSRVKASRKFIRGGGAVTDLFQIVSRLEQVGGTLALEGDRIRYSIPSGDTSTRVLLAELRKHREGVRGLLLERETEQRKWPPESLDGETRFGQAHAKLFPFLGSQLR
jgi:hypothetical protein